MSKRVVMPEWLDHLPQEDPEARRSRRDLRRINFLMGNERWIRGVLRRHEAAARRGIVEIGAGDGALCGRLARMFPDAPVSAYDLMERPVDLPASVVWHRGDLLEAPVPETGGVLVANLFLHHFEGELLTALGRWISRFDLLVINEPDRSRAPHVLGALMHPFINRVTRHDMHVSIRAGFAGSEIGHLLGLDAEGWEIRENSTWRGSRRVLAWRV
jgi:hypothetical protein